MRVGIDVGGTNTDAVLMDGERVLAEVNTGTTADVTSGIPSALGSLVGLSGVSADAVQAVMIDDELHERLRRGKAPDLDRRSAARPPGDEVAAAADRLAGADPGRRRRQGLSLPRRSRVRRPADLAARLRRAPARRRGHRPQRPAVDRRLLRLLPVNAEFELEAAEIFTAELPASRSPVIREAVRSLRPKVSSRRVLDAASRWRPSTATRSVAR